MIRRPPRSTLFPTRRSSDLAGRRLLSARLPQGESGPAVAGTGRDRETRAGLDRKSTRLNSSHQIISYAVFCLKKKKKKNIHKTLNKTKANNWLYHMLNMRDS